MKLTNVLYLCILTSVFFVPGCKSPPEPEPEPSIEIPVPEPEVISEVKLPREIELEGPQWILTYLFGTDRVRVPQEEIVWISFQRYHEPSFFGTGGTNSLMGSYRIIGQDMNRPPEVPSQKSGAIQIQSVASTRMAGRYLAYENLFIETLGLVQGYIIHGSGIQDGRLTLFGGHGREEIVLAEFRSVPGEFWEE